MCGAIEACVEIARPACAVRKGVFTTHSRRRPDLIPYLPQNARRNAIRVPTGAIFSVQNRPQRPQGTRSLSAGPPTPPFTGPFSAHAAQRLSTKKADAFQSIGLSRAPLCPPRFATQTPTNRRHSPTTTTNSEFHLWPFVFICGQFQSSPAAPSACSEVLKQLSMPGPPRTPSPNLLN